MFDSYLKLLVSSLFCSHLQTCRFLHLSNRSEVFTLENTQIDAEREEERYVLAGGVLDSLSLLHWPRRVRTTGRCPQIAVPEAAFAPETACVHGDREERSVLQTSPDSLTAWGTGAEVHWAIRLISARRHAD